MVAPSPPTICQAHETGAGISITGSMWGYRWETVIFSGVVVEKGRVW